MTGIDSERLKAILATVEMARAAPLPAGRRSSLLIEHGTMQLRFYAPRGSDPQTPHDQDELYLVWKGKGWFVNGAERHRFAPGDVLFVPAGVTHRFEDFTDDLEVWVVFWGPKGGEHPAGVPGG
jgi:mannose-6-phosphate isomerase-like protein (cupin superfamily)